MPRYTVITIGANGTVAPSDYKSKVTGRKTEIVFWAFKNKSNGTVTVRLGEWHSARPKSANNQVANPVLWIEPNSDGELTLAKNDKSYLIGEVIHDPGLNGQTLYCTLFVHGPGSNYHAYDPDLEVLPPPVIIIPGGGRGGGRVGRGQRKRGRKRKA